MLGHVVTLVLSHVKQHSPSLCFFWSFPFYVSEYAFFFFNKIPESGEQTHIQTIYPTQDLTEPNHIDSQHVSFHTGVLTILHCSHMASPQEQGDFQ